MRTYIALFIISTLLVQMVVPMETLALKRTAETIDYYGGIGGGLGGVSVNSSAATGVATMTGSITRTVVQTGYPTTPFAPMHVGGVPISLSLEQRTQIVNLVKTDKTQLKRSLQTAQSTIISSATQCMDRNVSTCIYNALKKAIQVTPAPIKAVLIAIQKVIATPHGFYALLTSSYPIIQELSESIQSIKKVLDHLLKMITNNKYGGSPQQNPNQTAMHTKQNEDDQENKCPSSLGGYRASAPISNGGTRIFEGYSLAHEDNKNKGLIICISVYINHKKRENIKKTLPKMYHEKVSGIKKITGLQPQKRVTLFVSSLLLVDNKHNAFAYRNNIVMSDELEKPNYPPTLAHEMVHVLFNQHNKVITLSANEGIASYIECEFKKTTPCSDIYSVLIKTIKDAKIKTSKKEIPTIFPEIERWMNEKKYPRYNSAYFYMEQLIRYLLNKIVLKQKLKDPYAPLKEMFKSKNIDAWIWNVAVNQYLNSDVFSFLKDFEEFLLSLPDN